MLLMQFYANLWKLLFGDHLVSFNIHGLMHLSECVKQYGSLDSFSAYTFENYIQYMKKLIRNPNHILEQIFLRINERKCTSKMQPNFNEHGTFKLDFKNEWNLYCSVKSKGPFNVVGIGVESGKNVFWATFLNVLSNFLYSSRLIECVRHLTMQWITEQYNVIFRRRINYKFYCIPYENKYPLIPFFQI